MKGTWGAPSMRLRDKTGHFRPAMVNGFVVPSILGYSRESPKQLVWFSICGLKRVVWDELTMLGSEMLRGRLSITPAPLPSLIWYGHCLTVLKPEVLESNITCARV